MELWKYLSKVFRGRFMFSFHVNFDFNISFQKLIAQIVA